ncbi:MAG: xanthine dehydrogenase family protein subunit M [Thermoanaerobaculaceae bacterium]|nr:xanthine dehydrogenase family protein subunit M [Thermoanaerobaculaceae bacterium]
MDLPIRRLLRPRDPEEAVELLARYPGALPVAGGTDLVVQLRSGKVSAETLVDLGGVGLEGIAEGAEGLVIGAATTMDAIAADGRIRAGWPALAQAASQVGAWPIQCRATLGGNLANASPAADTAPPLLIANAQLRLLSSRGTRLVPLAEFFLGPGRSVRTPEEIILSVTLPPRTVPAHATLYERFTKVGPRREQIISVVSLAARLVVAGDGSVGEVALAVGAVAPTPRRARRAEAVLAGRRLTGPVRRDAIAALQEELAPIDDVRAPAWYRRVAAAVLLDRFLAEVAGG